ncbi:MAG: YihY/virulence factor BrkB family protein [Halobacteriaceae archaeon]
MSQTVARGRVAARALLRAVRDSRLTFLAAAVAYYAFVSLVPLFLVSLAVGSALFGDELATYAVETAGGALAPSGEQLLRDAILNADGRTGVGIVSVVVLAWGGLRLFRGLDAAFSQVYGVEAHKSLGRQLLDAATVLSAIGLAAVAAVVVGGVAPAMHYLPDVLSPLPLVAALTVAFFPMFYVFPDVDVDAREVLPGTVFAAVGWTALTATFGLYASNVGGFALYGVLGAALLLVTWLYLASIIIILGGVLNAVLAGRTDADGETETETDAEDVDGPAPDITALEREVERLRTRLDEKTVDRSTLEADLKRYVRGRMRRGHARGWGPYLVLAYGTAMTVGAFSYLDGGWAILAMLVVWLSTLGLYALMLLVGAGLAATGLPGRVLDWVRARRS